MDGYKWHASKMVPKVYGDRQEHEHTGSVTVEIRRFAEIEAGDVIDGNSRRIADQTSE